MATDQEIANRVRAALAFADINIKDAPTRIGISYATMQRIVSPTGPRGADHEERTLIADGCGVPMWFLDDGFTGGQQADDPSALERIEALERRHQAAVAEIRMQINEIRQALRELGEDPH